MASSSYVDFEGRRIDNEILELNRGSPPDLSLPIWKSIERSYLNCKQVADRKTTFHRTFIRTRRAAGVMLVVGVVCGSVALSVDAFRIPISNFFQEKKANYSVLHVVSEDEKAEVKIPWENPYLPTELPFGYHLSLADEMNLEKNLIYSNGNAKQQILFTLYQYDNLLAINTENVFVNEMTIHNHPAFWFHQKGFINLYWLENGMTFSLKIPDQIENFIEIAESVKILK